MTARGFHFLLKKYSETGDDERREERRRGNGKGSLPAPATNNEQEREAVKRSTRRTQEERNGIVFWLRG